MKYKRRSSEVLKQVCKLSEEYYKISWLSPVGLPPRPAWGIHWYWDCRFWRGSNWSLYSKVVCQEFQREKGLAKAQFMQKLQLSENRQIRELAGRHSCCIWLVLCFKPNQTFPKRTDFYKQGLDILLVVGWWGALNEMKFIVICLYLKSSNCWVKLPSPLSKVITFLHKARCSNTGLSPYLIHCPNYWCGGTAT